MTQAYNLAILANAVNSSGQLNVGTNATGTLPVANGGTGSATLTANNVLLGNGTSALQVVAPGTNGNVLTSNGTTWTSAAPSGGVTSLNGQTGAITDTSTNAIGSYGCFATLTNGATYNYGGTIAGSSLRRVIRTSPDNFTLVTLSTPLSTATASTYANPSLSGTWRWMSGQIINQGGACGADSCAPGLLVRIS